MGNHQRRDRPILQITPRIDQRNKWCTKNEQGLVRREIIEHLTRQELHSSKKKKDGRIASTSWTKTQPMSEETKSIIVEQGKIEAFELLELTDTTQCEICDKYMSVGHI